MKPISSELLAHLSEEVTTLAVCWKLTRRDGAVLGFASHDRDIIYDGVTYIAEKGFTPTYVASNSDLAADDMELEGIIDGEVILEADIQAGIYDFAEVEIFMVNYMDLSQGKLDLRCGWLGEVQYSKGHFSAKIRGLTQSLSPDEPDDRDRGKGSSHGHGRVISRRGAGFAGP